MAAAKKSYTASIRTLWAIAKSPELSLTDDELHAVVYGQTGKESMKQLTQGEINQLARVLQNMKDSGQQKELKSKRTDEGGDPRTAALRRKIYALCGELGWNDDNRRINGFIKKQYGIERIEWLTKAQCSSTVEALKKMLARQEEVSDS